MLTGLTEEIPPRRLDALTVHLDQSQKLTQRLAIETIIMRYPDLWAQREPRLAIPGARRGCAEPALSYLGVKRWSPPAARWRQTWREREEADWVEGPIGDVRRYTR
jgi:hypothetical protein